MKTREEKVSSILLMVFVPVAIFYLCYLGIGSVWQKVPSLLLFFMIAVIVLFPAELGMILWQSKKQDGRYSLVTALVNQKKMKVWKTFLYGMLLFAFAGLMSITIQPLENDLMSFASDQFTALLPSYFDWTDMALLRQYPIALLRLTCVGYFLMNVIVGPVVEELFFRGYLTAKLAKKGIWAPVIVTVLFSLYHFWLPFNNLFRIAVFLPASIVAWKKNNIYISMVFHCTCNLFSTISFFILLFGY
ncbi:MAG TPA: CPBP family intramembrane glutamic endopeptidase [Lachnospiraceae bacterium]|nr:CPBP family intramembrane glutamic endopeptidase [Lachnospiraceae bacterium]